MSEPGTPLWEYDPAGGEVREVPTVRVRIAVAVNVNGFYSADGGRGASDQRLTQNVRQYIKGAHAVHWVEADVPLPALYSEGIRETDTLNVRQARETDDERHLAPLQLGVVERAVKLWTNPGEIVATPFGGIGTEGKVARDLGRRAKLVELKESYWLSLIQNVSRAGVSSGNYSLMDSVDAD